MSELAEVVRAAGTLLWRPAELTHPTESASGPEPAHPRVEVALVHRVRRDDWSLPKGKLETSETWAAAAVRETHEETGHAVLLGPPLPSQRYLVEGRPKLVRYWAARTTGDDDLADGFEVDRLAWLSPEEARERLSYAHDATVVDEFVSIEEGLVLAAGAAESPVPDADVLVVLRHAKAVKRAAWDGRDRARPLDARGEAEAVALAPWLAAYGPDLVLSSDSTRCLDTVTPYAVARSLAIEHEPLFSEEGFVHSRRHAIARVRELLASGGRSVVCTHRPVLPSLLRHVVGRPDAVAALPLPPAGAVIIHHVRGRVLSVERHGPEDLAP